MTAICGIHDAGAGRVEALDAMLAALDDRGPQQAMWTEGEVGFGARGAWSPACPARRASLPSPFSMHRDAGLLVAADGRLDDRVALCDILGVPPHEGASRTDVELILQAFMRWGRDCPHHLLGDYAFAVWDMRRRTLFCARDHVGARPFYYSTTRTRRFVFASAVEAVLAVPGVSDALDETVVAAYLAGEPYIGGRTFFAAVRTLPPGHTLTVEAKAAGQGSGRLRVRIERWWRPEQAPHARPASDEAYAEELLHLHAQAVRDRLRGGPVGVHLSGGLDSSGITVLAARDLRRQGRPPPSAFTWLPPPGDVALKLEHTREYALIDAVCTWGGVRAFHCGPSPQGLLDVLQRDGTLPGVQVQVNEEFVQRRSAAQGVRVLLSGWGGDECVSFNGRGHWQHLLLSGRWRGLATEYRDQDASAPRFLAQVLAPLLHPALWRPRQGKRPLARGLASPAFVQRVKPPTAPRSQTIGVRSMQSNLLQIGHLATRIEGWAASGARRGIEYRYPLLDRRLLEFALGLPPEQFRRGRWGRWLFRHAMRTVLPPEVCLNRNKTEPARTQPTGRAFAETFPVIRRLLAARTSSRTRYVDMPRLWEYLYADSFKKIPEPGRFLRALYFLDL